MVNDTTTLNGALSELGETMADNLFSMGVIDADASDGLTTLANKILNIEPSISGLDLDTSLTIHSSDTSCLIGQSIMFWAELKADYDDETATDVDLSGVLTGATVTFKNGNTVLGTGVTDADGIAYYTHTFATGGTYNITASFAGTENFDDCVSSSITVSVTYEMTITADKPILSFEDSDVATITATLSDGVAGVGGETLSYEVLDKDDNVLDSGSDVTDSNGEISFTYVSAGIGDVQVVVYYGMSLQETYELEDVDFYDDTTRDRTSDYTFTRVVYDKNNNGSQSISFNNNLYNISVTWGGCYYFIPLTTKSQVELSYISKSPHTNDTGDCGFGLIDRTGNKGNSVYTRVNGTRRFTKNSSATSWSHIYNQTGSSLADVEIRHIITVNGLSFTYKAIRTDNETVIWEYSDTFDSNLGGKELGIITGWGSCSHTIKRIKVKAL